MGVSDIGLVARARGVATHLIARQTLATLADADDVESFTHHLSRLPAVIDPITEPGDVFAVERAILATASRHLATLRRWADRAPNALDVFTADQDRRSLRALLRGAAAGAPAERRVAGLLPTPSLPHDAVTELARCATPTDVVRRLVDLGYGDAKRLLEMVGESPADLLSLEIVLLRAFAERVVRTAARADDVLRGFVESVIDVANAQHALLVAGEPRELKAGELFVRGGRWLSAAAFASVAAAASAEAALAALAASVARSPLSSWLPVVPRDLAHLDRAFLVGALAQLTRAMRLDPLSSAAVLRVLLLLEAQARDLRTLVWGAALGAPAALRRQQLVTPA
jgi:vacuolar-type H+-ATPase subunit C/Vma6